ncbi:MAG: RusA family crossover junction endodeoxyribonuclease [Candidatus Methanoperedens sp.]
MKGKGKKNQKGNSMNNDMDRRVFSGNAWFLEGYDGCIGILIDVETASKNKPESIKKIRENFGKYFENKKFEIFKNIDTKLDIAIFLEVNSYRYSKQDLDNIQKVVFDALKKDKEDSSWKYLCEDDSQIVRVIAWKILNEKIERSNTASMTITFRTHNPAKQMMMRHYREDFSISDGFV